MLDQAQVNSALQLHTSGTEITAHDVAQILQNRSTTFAQIIYVTEPKLAAKHKDRKVQKITEANVQLFSNINAATQVFANAVKKTAAQIASNDPTKTAAFEQQTNYFEHTGCYSVVEHKLTRKQYLYAVFNRAASCYLIDGCAATLQAVAELMTPAAAQELLNPKATVKNATHDIEHTVRVRTIALENVVQIRANHTVITA